MRTRFRPPLVSVALLAVALALACSRPAGTASTSPGPSPPPQVSVAPLVVEPQRLRAHVGFLASDTQEGRAPGTDADTRVQTYIADAFREAGLAPAFVDGYRQSFQLTDGVRPREGTTVVAAVAGNPLPHAIVPFSTDGVVEAEAIYLGYGMAPQGRGSGDYEALEGEVAGRVVVVRDGGPDDPHLSPAALRPQTKLIAARDHGAVGFVLWEPDGDGGYPNHGRADDLGLPAVFVGRDGTDQILAAFGAVAVDDLDRGATSNKGTISLQTPLERVVVTTANVAGRLLGSGASDRILVLGAHMDHLGWGTSSSLAPGERAIHNGADDNASGVAAILELARGFGAQPVQSRPYDVLFLTFGAEEMGLLGSKHFVRSLDPEVRGRIVAMLNFDMIGRLSNDELLVSGVGTAKEWPALVAGLKQDLKIKTSDDGYGPSDHGSFYEAKIPVLHFFTGPHEDYHRPSDDVGKIEFTGVSRVAAFAGRVAVRLLEEQIRPEYLEVARTTPRRGGFRISLGTIPDYAADVDGVALSGVRTGGPAHRAGLRKGDVIQKLGEREIHNLDDYMASFATMKPGKNYVVVVERDGKGLELEITPDRPKQR